MTRDGRGNVVDIAGKRSGARSERRVEEFHVDDYLAAVGLSREEPGLNCLNRLHEAHVTAFPFANVDVLLGSHPGGAVGCRRAVDGPTGLL